MKKIKNLFVLRWYANGLKLLAEISMLVYILFSLINLFSSKSNGLMSFIIGLQGIPIILGALALIFISQIIDWAVGIFDRLDIIKKNTLSEKIEIDNNYEYKYYRRNLITVYIIAITLIMGLLNFSKIIYDKKMSTSNNIDDIINSESTTESTSNLTYNVTSLLNYTVTAGCLILVADNDFPEPMSYNEAILACSKLGDEWRLPDEDEAIEIHRQLFKNTKGDFSLGQYWCTKSLNMVQRADGQKYFSFIDGQISETNDNNNSINESSKLYVRPVKTISCK